MYVYVGDKIHDIIKPSETREARDWVQIGARYEGDEVLGKYPHFILTKDKLGVRHCISMADVVIKMRGEKRHDIRRGDSIHSIINSGGSMGMGFSGDWGQPD